MIELTLCGILIGVGFWYLTKKSGAPESPEEHRRHRDIEDDRR